MTWKWILYSLDLCDLNLDPTDTTVCRAGADKVVSFFVSPPSETATAIDCPTSPFRVDRKFDCKAEVQNCFCSYFRKPQQTFFLFRHQHGGNLTFRNLGLTPKSAIIALVAVVTRILTMMSTPWSGPAIPWLVWLMQLMLQKWISAAIVVKKNDFSSFITVLDIFK